jgi:hypothetical protein
MGSYTKVGGWNADHAEQMKNPEFAAEFAAKKRELDFAVALAKARDERNLNQSQLSLATGIKRPMLSRYEHDEIPELPCCASLPLRSMPGPSSSRTALRSSR